MRAFHALRPGGQLVLTIPDKERTFDRARAPTTLDHLIEDYRAPSRKRDQQHYIEYHELAFPADWRRSYDRDFPIHFHVWTYETFMELIGWVVREAAPFKGVWSHPTLSHPTNDFEFYVTLTK